MADETRELARVRNSMLVVSAVAWILLVIETHDMSMAASPAAAASAAMPAMNSPAFLAVDWVLMLIAMMAPVLIQPVRHVRLRTFKHRRARSVGLFIAGYAALWVMLGGAPLAIERAVKLPAPPWYVTMGTVAAIALLWQFSPIKQRCLNRCHAHTELAAFGAAADFGALRFGMTHGAWCAGSCWALMLVPMVMLRGHIFAMAGAAVLIFSERLELPRPPSWRCRGFGKVLRILVAQSKLRWHRRRSFADAHA